MADNEVNSDFRSIVNAAAANWYSQRSDSPDKVQANRNDRPASPIHTDVNGGSEPNGASTRNDITVWQSTLQVLPDDSKGIPLPIHPLAQALAEQPTLRSVEWNPYRQQGGFKPRTAIDYSSLMIYLSGQANPNPCRNCRLKNGPYARCIVAPPSVLALSSLKHACANCTYQNQHRKCTNLPIDDEELVARSRMARSSLKLRNPTPMKPPGRRPKPVTENNADLRTRYKPDHGHMIRKPTAQSISADAFADKLRQVRSWSPRSRRRMKAEVMQWQAAVMTIEAENTRSAYREHTLEGQGAFGTPNLPAGIPPASHTPTNPAAASSMFAPPPSAPSVEGSLAELEAEGYDEEYDQHQLEDDEDENAEESDFEGTSWVGFNDMGPVLKPPL
ncbi:hypothetical protein F4804DRAFT_346066 [Jackrogersella minutella]|nr:hypothetical protein F4804DRAFT_346066 [Jackrogersella minutella]